MAQTDRTAETNGRLWGQRAQDWASLQEPVHRPAYEAVLGATKLATGLRYCDLGCGSGLAVQMAAVLGAEVSGLDAATDLLAIARDRTPTGQFTQGDLEDLPYHAAQFDVVSGFNAFQYAGNPSRALEEARRILTPDGLLAIVTWAPPEGMEAAKIVAALKTLLPPPPPGAPNPPGPFALSGQQALEGFATGAGFDPVEVFDVDCPFAYPDLPTAIRANSAAGVAVKAAEHAGQDAVQDAFHAVLSGFLQPDGSVRAMARFRCLIARP